MKLIGSLVMRYLPYLTVVNSIGDLVHYMVN